MSDTHPSIWEGLDSLGLFMLVIGGAWAVIFAIINLLKPENISPFYEPIYIGVPVAVIGAFLFLAGR